MKRLPLVASFLLFVALCASAAYWGMQMFKPAPRPVAAPPRVAQAEINPEPAVALFGGRKVNAAVASNYQLKGVIFSGTARDSVAILSADGKPPQAIRLGMEVMPGVTIKEVHRGYVLLSENGAIKRVELPEEAKDQGNLAYAPAPSGRTPVGPAPGQAIPSRAQAAAAAASQQPANPPPVMPPPATNVMPGQTQAAPGQVQPGMQQPNQLAGQSMPGQSTTGVPPTVVVSPPPSNPAGGVPATASASTMYSSGGGSSNPSNVPQQQYTPQNAPATTGNVPQIIPGMPPGVYPPTR